MLRRAISRQRFSGRRVKNKRKIDYYVILFFLYYIFQYVNNFIKRFFICSETAVPGSLLQMNAFHLLVIHARYKCCVLEKSCFIAFLAIGQSLQEGWPFSSTTPFS